MKCIKIVKMDSKNTVNTKNIRVSSYTHERILKFSKMFKLKQGVFIDIVIDIAEKCNFSSETQTEILQKSTTKDINRLIGFLKIQDKNAQVFEKKVMEKLHENSIQNTPLDSNEFLTCLEIKLRNSYEKRLKKVIKEEDVEEFLSMQKRAFLEATNEARIMIKNIDNVR